MKLFKKENLISRKNKSQNQGFVILFAVVLTSIILSVSLGLADITYKEISFGTSAKNTGDAFFASDTGAECALYYDYKGSPTADGGPENPFGYTEGSGIMTPLQCAGTDFQIPYDVDGPWNFTLFNLGPSGKACVKVTVYKDILENPPQIETRIVSKGYNLGGDNESCFSNSPNKVEREIELTYYEDIE